MEVFDRYESPLGTVILTADDQGLTRLYFQGAPDAPEGLENQLPKAQDDEFIQEGKHWLHGYFEGRHLGWRPPLHLKGSEFQNQVWKALLTIPYGQTVSYGDVAKEVARERHMEKMSARAVGGAVGSNPVCLIVPCHRVVGAGGSLTGYGGGLQRKVKLLELEGVDTSRFTLPQKSRFL
ncbi:MAG: methylated-DNA--[protein]-cysteine S-methyltransferase [Acidaminococcus sp.]|uniref:methylated-DNA--[protein]-cysteine S-methyltransferase n=1 Tax=Acidaminococcus TaxID=904 RepID=UPI0026E0B0BB|nr:methylated-DNA--[protein]-cysteine S-methyltransferase [Acidaminococcus sp.]MDO5597744.1 methylated-DNA--[protein]-cysteine S-methyltransferase [Acidaminococcus sp.]